MGKDKFDPAEALKGFIGLLDPSQKWLLLYSLKNCLTEVDAYLRNGHTINLEYISRKILAGCLVKKFKGYLEKGEII